MYKGPPGWCLIWVLVIEIMSEMSESNPRGLMHVVFNILPGSHCTWWMIHRPAAATSTITELESGDLRYYLGGTAYALNPPRGVFHLDYGILYYLP